MLITSESLLFKDGPIDDLFEKRWIKRTERGSILQVFTLKRTCAMSSGCGCWLDRNSPITLFMISWAGKKSKSKGGKTLATTLASDGTPFLILPKRKTPLKIDKMIHQMINTFFAACQPQNMYSRCIFQLFPLCIDRYDVILTRWSTRWSTHFSLHVSPKTCTAGAYFNYSLCA